MKRTALGQRRERKLFGGLRASSSFAKASGGTKIILRFTPCKVSGMALVSVVLAETSEGWPGVRMKPYIEERLKQIAIDAYSSRENPASRKPAP